MRRFHLIAAASATSVVVITVAVTMITLQLLVTPGLDTSARAAFAAGTDPRAAFEMVIMGGCLAGMVGWLVQRLRHRDGEHRMEALDAVWHHDR